MKQFIFLSFLIPSLCFAQLGINTPIPQAELHIVKKGDIPLLKIENIPNKIYDDTEPYENLIIDKNNIVKKTTISGEEGLGQESQIFYLKETYYRGYNNMAEKFLKLVNFRNSNMTDENDNIILPGKGTYALMMIFNGTVNSDESNIVMKPPVDRTIFSLGQYYVEIMDAGSQEFLDIAEATWLISPNTQTFSNSIMFVINNNKDEGRHIRIRLSKNTGVKLHTYMYAPQDESDIFQKTNIIMWKL